MIGETFVLKGNDSNNLIKENVSNLKVYSIDSVRVKHFFTEKVDYIIEGNKLRRTKNSKIPNFDEHVVVYNDDGTFTFNSFPRNPPLTIPFQLYADYDFSDFDSIYGNLDKSFLSEKLKNKIAKREKIKIGVIGTSITAGAHTLEQFYHNSDKDSYPYLIKKAIEKLYRNEVVITNYSQNGSSIDYLGDVFPTALKDNNDLMFIEFGMNDHIYSWWKSNLPNFELTMSNSVDRFKTHGIDVIMVGFFQQNQSWDLEFINSTIEYNQSLSNVSKKYNCYFADVNKEFSKYSQPKINQDFCGDFMHHPTSFGHLLYYKTIIPAFLKEDVNDGFIYNLVN
ncbi:SGNH/GDSL hydrolase family protein [Flavobacterium chungangensis]|uniref:SGNH/GDSL hydrolase family protein n=1 Tax=Flavobacterium chungangensis TaxID=2708132 RepID=A0ABV8ZI19_9FLAO